MIVDLEYNDHNYAKGGQALQKQKNWRHQLKCRQLPGTIRLER